MGYFSNGTEGAIYEAKYCERCLNYRGGMCPILMLHSVWNYEAIGQNVGGGIKQIALDMFIPRHGIENKQCAMFLNASPGQTKLDEDAQKLSAWNEGKPIKVTP
ncbi:MAG: hypothetical protein Q7T18_11825 [Sedimentisphaerales bacterium]|nr:hypothetical protein [Sedimentisphaerales bacterium]